MEEYRLGYGKVLSFVTKPLILEYVYDLRSLCRQFCQHGCHEILEALAERTLARELKILI